MSAGGRDDTSAYKTPFLAAAQAPAQGGGGFLSSIFGGGSPVAAAPAPLAGGVQVAQGPTDPIIAAGQNYSPLRDPTGPLARAGWIGSLFATGPSAQEHQAALMQQQADQLGAQRASAFKTLAGFVQAGQTPQKAFLSFLNTPQGVQFVTKDPNPTEAVQQFMKIATTPTDPTADAISNAFAGAPGGSGALASAASPVVPPTGMPAPAPGVVTPGGPLPAPEGTSGGAAGAPTPDLMSAALAGDPAVGGAAAPLPAGQQAPNAGATPGTVASPDSPLIGAPNTDITDPNSSAHWTYVAQKLAAVPTRKDAEGKIDTRAMEASKQALEIATQLAAVEQGKTTPDSVNYSLIQRQNKLMGKPTEPFSDWLLNEKRASSPAGDLGLQGEKARIDMNKTVYEKSIQPAAANAETMLQTLNELQPYLAADGGLKGASEAQLAKWGDLLGFKVTEGMANAQVLQALTAKMQAAFRPVGTGSTSDYEQTLFASAVPGILQSPEARQKISDINRRFAERAVQVGRIYQRYVGQPDKLADELDKLDKVHLFNPTETANMEALAKQGTGGPVGGPVPGGGADNSGRPSIKDAKGNVHYLNAAGNGWE